MNTLATGSGHTRAEGRRAARLRAAPRTRTTHARSRVLTAATALSGSLDSVCGRGAASAWTPELLSRLPRRSSGQDRAVPWERGGRTQTRPSRGPSVPRDLGCEPGQPRSPRSARRTPHPPPRALPDAGAALGGDTTRRGRRTRGWTRSTRFTFYCRSPAGALPGYICLCLCFGFARQ